MALPTLPPPVELSSETKKAVIDGLKKVLEVFRSKGLLDAKVTYSDVIHDPAVLRNFIQVYRANRELVDDLVVSAENTPVRDDTTPLSCGVTLEQIQQLLVKT
ncbi:MAG: hypothetical protein K2Q10_06190, partial [Rhodospirillales bacterium]|nr:hypothetical protein [Rhodospirillales bacterium]